MIVLARMPLLLSRDRIVTAGAPASRAAAVAFGVGTGVGSAYSDSQRTVRAASAADTVMAHMHVSYFIALRMV